MTVMFFKIRKIESNNIYLNNKKFLKVFFTHILIALILEIINIVI